MSETVRLTEEQKRELALLDFTPATPRCEVRWHRSPVDCGKDAEGLIVCLYCGFSLASSRSCWARALLVDMGGQRRGLTSQCGKCRREGMLTDLFVFREFGWRSGS